MEVVKVSVTTKTTVAEFAAIAGSADERLELIDGEIVRMPPAKLRHSLIQMRLVKLLSSLLPDDGCLGMEVAYRTAAGTIRIADVGFFFASTIAAEVGKNYSEQAPELVIEVASEETHEELSLRRRDAFATGTVEFWIVEPAVRTITAYRSNGVARVYEATDRVPVPFTDSATVGVGDILL